ncbi:MAG: peptide chain release factor N(5)-glutamine methyltransferase [Rhizobiales bacterium]|nr:peptide chain release factor N(5)-glutamine methyltransferase [Hyphomicrobiales bacterium]
MPPETVAGLIATARRRFEACGMTSAALDARLLLQHAAGLDHAAVIAEPQRQVTGAAANRFRGLVERRRKGEPVSRIVGEREFYGRSFAVTPAVLDPRPDTETLIDEVLGLKLDEGTRILDLGTGSGAIITTLLVELPTATGVATDISGNALAVARENAARLAGVGDFLRFVQSNWFDAVVGLFELIVSNPPYIPAGEIAGLAPDVRDFDPRLALDGGSDGLEAYRRIADGALAHLAAGGHVVVETGAGQAQAVEAVFAAHGFKLKGSRRDLAGHARCLSFMAS